MHFAVAASGVVGLQLANVGREYEESIVLVFMRIYEEGYISILVLSKKVGDTN